MARYKTIDTRPRFLAVGLEAQLLLGTFEHALNHLLDREIDLRGFDERCKNDDTGASAYPPAMLLKVVLLAYSRGIVSSRAIERACREQVTFIALSGDTEPTLRAKEVQRIEQLGREARRIREWLAENPEDRPGSRGAVRKSNRTDNESANRYLMNA